MRGVYVDNIPQFVMLEQRSETEATNIINEVYREELGESIMSCSTTSEEVTENKPCTIG
jgi:hypothetical protein